MFFFQSSFSWLGPSLALVFPGREFPRDEAKQNSRDPAHPPFWAALGAPVGEGALASNGTVGAGAGTGAGAAAVVVVVVVVVAAVVAAGVVVVVGVVAGTVVAAGVFLGGGVLARPGEGGAGRGG